MRKIVVFIALTAILLTGGVALGEPGVGGRSYDVNPTKDNTYDLGSTSMRWNSIHVVNTSTSNLLYLQNVENDAWTSASARSVLASESGSTFVLQTITGTTAGDIEFTLPTAAAGLVYTFVDANATAGNDLWITAAAGDKINGGTAAKSYKCTGDAVKQHVTVVAIDAERWEIIAEDGTWENDNN